jgi:hypothetical protein
MVQKLYSAIQHLPENTPTHFNVRAYYFYQNNNVAGIEVDIAQGSVVINASQVTRNSGLNLQLVSQGEPAFVTGDPIVVVQQGSLYDLYQPAPQILARNLVASAVLRVLLASTAINMILL